MHHLTRLIIFWYFGVMPESRETVMLPFPHLLGSRGRRRRRRPRSRGSALFVKVPPLADRLHPVGYRTPVPTALQWKEVAETLRPTSLQLVQCCDNRFKAFLWQYTASTNCKEKRLSSDIAVHHTVCRHAWLLWTARISMKIIRD